MPVPTGIAAGKPLAEIVTRVTQMIPFGLGAMGGQARQIEEEYEALGKEAPYYAMVIGGALSGVGEMATELPVFMGVARLLKGGGKALVNEGAKTLIDKYGKLGIEFIKNVALQSWQEAEMVPIEKGVKQAIGLPQDWSIEPLIKEMGVNAYGGMAMALVLGGLGGSVAGSTIVATKTGQAIDNFIQNKGDIRETLRVIAEAQGIIPRQPEAVALGKEAEEPQPTPAIPAELEGLAEEARKAKDVDEFVGSQKNVYHGTTSDIKEFDIKNRYGLGIFKTDAKSPVIFFAENRNDAEYFADLRGGQNIVKAFISKDAKIIDFTGLKNTNTLIKNLEKIREIDPEWADDIDEGNADIHDAIEDPLFIQKIKDKGYDAIRSIEPEGHGVSLAVINKDIIKTKAQLSSIYTQATEQPSAVAPVAEKATTVPTKAEVKAEKPYSLNKELTPEQRIEGNKLMGQIHKVVNQKGLTGVKFADLKRQHGMSPHLATATKRMTIPQLEAVLQAVNRARPKRIGYKDVVTPKTEKKIQSLKDNLIDKLQMSEEAYTSILKSEGVYKEPKYTDASNFITEKQGKDVIYRLIGESDILRETLPYNQAVEKQPAIKKLIDKEKEIIGKYRDKGLRDPKELNSARIIFQKMEEITGAPIYRMYQSLIDISLENKEKAAVFLHEFEEYKDIIKDEKAIKRVADYITSKSNLKNKPEYPEKITEQEIKMAKKIEGILKDYQAKARTEKFLEDIEFPQKIPQYEQYKKEIDKAKDIYEGKGYDDLVEYMKTQEWGIIRNGYDPLQVVSNELRMWKPKPQTFGKSHIKVRTDIEYHEQDKNILERLFSYKKQMDNLVDMRPKVRAFMTLIDENIDKFQNPQRIKEGVEIFLRELKGYNRPEGLVERELNRAYAQAMQVIILPSPAMFARNVLQPYAFGFDKSILIDPRNKKLTSEETDYMNTYVSQIQSMKIDWFMVGEKPYFGRLGKGLMKLVNKVGIYPYSDQLNRITSFWARINQTHRAFADIDKNSTEKQLSKAMGQAKFNDMERTERIMALEILAKDGVEAMSRYMARVFTADTQFQYNRAERSFAEMGKGKWLTNLMLFPRAYNEMLLKQAKHFKEGTISQKVRASKVVMSIIIGGMIMSAIYKKVTGRRQSPYGFLELLAYEPGGLAIGTIEAATDVYVSTVLAVGGDERSIAALSTAIPRLANMWMPFYDYTLRGYEAATNQKNVDVRAIRKIREIFDKEYKTRGDAYEIERNAMQKLQYLLAGAGVDVGIKEREAEKKKTPLVIDFAKSGKKFTFSETSLRKSEGKKFSF